MLMTSAKFVHFLFILLAMSASGAALAEQQSVLSVDGKRFLLDGQPIDLWGIRVGSATMNDPICQHLIDHLDDYCRHGVNAVTVFYMGCSGGYHDPFTPDGRGIDAEHQRRMERILHECAQRQMVVIVGIFYQRVELGLEDQQAMRRAVRTVTERLAPHRNAIINIANEQNSRRYQGLAQTLNDTRTIIDLCRVVHEADPKRLVGGGGYDHAKNEVIGRSEHVDVLLFDTNGPKPGSADLYRRFRTAGVRDKPIVNVETFGGWTANFPPGVFPEELRAVYRAEVDAAIAEPGLSVFFHNNPWLQDAPMRYDLGGEGTADAPGIRWYFECVRSQRSR
jgi:hypothetical protein